MPEQPNVLPVDCPVGPVELAAEPLYMGPGNLLFRCCSKMPRTVLVAHYINTRTVGDVDGYVVTLSDLRMLIHTDALERLQRIVADHATGGQTEQGLTVLFADLGITDSILTETIAPGVLDVNHPYTGLQLRPRNENLSCPT